MPTARKLVVGAAPEGARDPDAAARAVREMFTSIAPRYDLLNHFLSFSIDRLWWRRPAQTGRELQSAALGRRLLSCHAAARPAEVSRQGLTKRPGCNAALDRSRRALPSVSRPA